MDLSWLQIFETSRDVVWINQPDRNEIVYVSPAYEEVWGRSKEDLYRDCSTWIETIYPDDRLRVMGTFASTLDRGYGEIEYRIVLPDSSVRWIEDRGFVIRDEKGQVVRVAGVARDISDRKQREIELERSNQRYKFLTDLSLNLLRKSHLDIKISHFLDRFTSLLKFKYYLYYLPTEDGSHLRLEASKGFNAAILSKIETIDFDATIEGTAFQSEGRFEIKDVQNSADPLHDTIRSLGITAYSCYAILNNDLVLGTLSFGKDAEVTFTAEEITLLRYLVDLVGVILSLKQNDN